MDLEPNGNGSQVNEISLLRISSCKRDENLKLVLEGNQKFKNVLQVFQRGSSETFRPLSIYADEVQGLSCFPLGLWK